MKIVHPICCGIDVHKKFLVATIVSAEKAPALTYQKKRFSTFNRSLRELRDWLVANRCYDACMESTGKYWVPVFNILEQDIRVVIANPKWVRAIKGNKDDVKDSKWIGELFCFGLVKSSFIPEKPVRILREFTRYRSKLVANRASEKNRFPNGFTVCNIALDSVVSDMFGVSASGITNYLLTETTPDPSACTAFLRGSLRKKADEVVGSVEGCCLTEDQKWRMLKTREHMEFIDKSIGEIDERLDSLVKPYEPAVHLLCTIPGVKRESAITILSEIGTDMAQFSSSRKLCCWAGLTPGNNQSAGKKKTVRITRAGVYLKPCLVEVAHAAVKCKSQPYYRNKYERVAHRRGKKRALIAIARMILTAIYHMLTNGEIFNPSDWKQEELPNMLRKQKKESIRHAVKLLKRSTPLPEELDARLQQLIDCA